MGQGVKNSSRVCPLAPRPMKEEYLHLKPRSVIMAVGLISILTTATFLTFSTTIIPLFYNAISQDRSLLSPSVNESSINTVIWDTIGKVDSIDPHKNGAWTREFANFLWDDYNYDSSRCVLSNIYETLISYGFDSANTTTLVPLLAESVDISDDGLNYTFTLRQNVRFHDGTPFNATCVQMNFWRILGRGCLFSIIAEPIFGGQAVENAFYEHGYRSTEHIAAWYEWQMNSDAIIVIDEFTVRIRLAYPHTPFLSILARPLCSMVSPTFFMAHGGMSPESEDSTLDEEACGTGPYRLAKLYWTPDPVWQQMPDCKNIELTLFDDYWRANDAKTTHPNAGAITNVIIKENRHEDSRMLNLLEGWTSGCDWPATNVYDIWNNLTDRDYGISQSLKPEVKLWKGNPIYRGMLIGFNMNPYLPEYSGDLALTLTTSVQVDLGLRQNPFTDYELRAAVSYAFDYQSSIDNDLNGLGVPLRGPIPQGMFAHDDELFMFERNMTEAIRHWNLAMANGLDEVWANNSYELNIYYSKYSEHSHKMGLQVKKAIENIIADPSSMDPSSPLTINMIGPYSFVVGDLVQNEQLSLFFLDWTGAYADPDNYVTPFVRSTSRQELFNDSHVGNRIGLAGSTGEGGAVWDYETVDGWIDAAAAESDPAERISLYAQIQEAIIDHCAYLWCFQNVEFHVERYEMNGYVFNPMRNPYFFHYYKTYRILGENQVLQIVAITAIAIVFFATVIVFLNWLLKLD